LHITWGIYAIVEKTYLIKVIIKKVTANVDVIRDISVATYSELLI